MTLVEFEKLAIESPRCRAFRLRKSDIENITRCGLTMAYALQHCDRTMAARLCVDCWQEIWRALAASGFLSLLRERALFDGALDVWNDAKFRQLEQGWLAVYGVDGTQFIEFCSYLMNRIELYGEVIYRKLDDQNDMAEMADPSYWYGSGGGSSIGGVANPLGAALAIAANADLLKDDNVGTLEKAAALASMAGGTAMLVALVL